MRQTDHFLSESQMEARRVLRHFATMELRFPLLLLVCALCYAFSFVAQGRASDEIQESHVMEPAKDVSVDTSTMVEALANHNPPPNLLAIIPDAVPPCRIPLFDAEFDWRENDRVWRAVSVLIEHAEDAWPELVKHLDDERYCITIEVSSSFTYNWNVGDMCREIIGRNLAEAYYRNIQPLTMPVNAQLRRPQVARDKKMLKSWCEERNKKKLYELQIETCKWAITQLRKPENNLRGVSNLRLRTWIAAIDADIESLRESGTAVGFDGFGPEELVPYSREKADRMRERYHRRPGPGGPG